MCHEPIRNSDLTTVRILIGSEYYRVTDISYTSNYHIGVMLRIFRPEASRVQRVALCVQQSTSMFTL
jgi:hypothetical protein